MSSHSELMQNLKEKHTDILKLIANRPVVYLDIPIYDNIGDLLIMHGTLKFFQENNIDVTSILSNYNFHEKAIEKNSVIVFQGGGNFGDLYTNHQNFREKIIQKFKNNTIIILPQSIYFKSDFNYKKCCKIFKAHDDVHIFCRDIPSLHLAKNMSKHTYLMPDMAHQLYPIHGNDQINKNETLFLERRDGESALNINNENSTDWGILLKKHKPKTRMIKKLFKLSNFLKINQLTSKYLSQLWISHSYVLTKEVNLLFSKYDMIKTDRLHGHIFACLMNKTNEVYDNSYNKNFNYINQWTLQSPLVKKKEVA